MHHREFEPQEELRGIIKNFWHTRLNFSEEHPELQIVPDGNAEIIFHFGKLCRVEGDGYLQQLPSPFLMGLLGKPIMLYAKEPLHVIGIKCFPWIVFDLLGLPSGNDGVRIFEHPIARLQPVLHELVKNGKIDEAITTVKQYFLNIDAGITTDSVLSKAGIAMSQAKGSIQVVKVAEAAHATVRTLERTFKRSSGFTVKDVSALMRFEQVRNRLWLDPETNLAGLAHEMGYTDQAHLSREFKRYTNTTPAAFARKNKKTRQVITDDFVAFIQS